MWSGVAGAEADLRVAVPPPRWQDLVERRQRPTRAPAGRSADDSAGPEILIVADIVETITVDPALYSALTVGLIVLVRTFLHFSLSGDRIDGDLPWLRGFTRRGRRSGGGRLSATTAWSEQRQGGA